MLPYGHLREPLGGLARADCIVLTRTDEQTKLDSIITTLTKELSGKPRSFVRACARPDCAGWAVRRSKKFPQSRSPLLHFVELEIPPLSSSIYDVKALN